MKYHLHIISCVAFITLLACFNPIKAQNGTNRLAFSNGIPVTTPNNCTMDVMSTNGECNDQTLQLIFGVDHNFSEYISQEMTVELMVEITDINGNNAVQSVLLIKYYPFTTAASEYIDRATELIDLSFSPARVTILSILVTPLGSATYATNELPHHLYLDGFLNANCIVDFDPNVQPTIGSPNFGNVDCDTDQTEDEIYISWGTLIGAEEYQLEWTYLNDYLPPVGNSPAYQTDWSQLEFDFRHNSSRITTRNTYYSIPNLFDHGFVIFRVRGVGRHTTDPDFYFAGRWSCNAESGLFTLLGGYSGKIAITQPHEKKLNWQVTTTFAEEGKKKEVMSYFDGSQRNRQTITRLNTNKKVVVGETIYDHQGRPAINILPTPVPTPPGTCAPGNSASYSSLHYYEGFNLNSDNEPYNRTNFDYDNGTICEPHQANALNTTSGASQYYSPNNPEIVDQQAYVPDAFGYPMSQVEYTPDNTGKIRKQGGVGPEFQLGSGHETSYFYSTPNQLELDRMFGSEVGNHEHYKKNMVVDPNGQVSVSYLDMEGRTVATALAGENPENLLPLTSMPANDSNIEFYSFHSEPGNESQANIIDENAGTLTFNSDFAVAVPGSYLFTYHLGIPSLQADCMAEGICFNCVYELEISITSECGTTEISYPEAGDPPLVGRFVQNGNEINFVTTCDDDAVPTGPISYDKILNNGIAYNFTEPGTYMIHKVLRIHGPARQAALQEYLNDVNNTCLDLNDLPPTADIGESDCDITCAECAESLGDVDTYVANTPGGTPEEYAALLAACYEPCNNYTSPCKAALDMMLSDVMIGGQYGTYTTNNQGIMTSNSSDGHYLSVFNTSNLLPKRTGAHWKNPNNILLEDGNPYCYIDNTGQRTKIPLTDMGNNTYSPSIDNNALVYTDEFGDLYTWPENLTNINDFLANWENGWEYSLVYYHPEWCYYEVCLTWGDGAGNAPHDNILQGELIENSSAGFDRLLYNTNTAADAIANGLLGADGTPSDWLHNNPGDAIYDPFMNLTNLQDYEEYANQLINKWNNFITTPLNESMEEVAARMLRCPGSVFSDPLCTAFGTNPGTIDPQAVPDFLTSEWLNFKNLYISTKQTLQKKFADEWVIDNECHAFNECIGEDYFNGFQYPEFASMSSFPNWFAMPYANGYEPCCYYIKHLYSDKTPRFIGMNDIEGSEYANDPNYMGAQVYAETGQCPLDIALQLLLNGVAASGQLTSFNLELSTLPEFGGLMVTLNGGQPLTNIITDYNCNWSANYNAPILDVTITPGSSNPFLTSVCELQLNFGNVDITTVEHFISLDYTGMSGTNYLFDIQAVGTSYDGNGNPVQQYGTVISGSSSCFPLGQCSFAPTPMPNALAYELQDMMNMTLGFNEWVGSLPMEFDTDEISPDPPVPFSVGNWLNSGTGNVYWDYISGNEWHIVGPNTYPYIKMYINTTDPSGFNYLTLNSSYRFENFNTECGQLFRVDLIENGSEILVATLHGELWLVTGAGQQEPLITGTCELPDPLSCQGTSFDNQEALYALFADALVEYYNPPYDIFTNSLFTQALCNQMPTCPSVAGNASEMNKPNNKKGFNFNKDGDCIMYFETASAAPSNFDFSNITAVGEMLPYGTPDFNGDYYQFTLDVTYSTGPNTTSTLVLIGETCWPLNFCDHCEESENTSNTGGTGTVVGVGNPDDNSILSKVSDYSVTKYWAYTSSLAAFNQKLGFVEGDGQYINPIDYASFYEGGYAFAADRFAIFLENFVIDVDDLNLADIRAYTERMGNSQNPVEEYRRYLDHVTQFNENHPANAIEPISDILFADERLSGMYDMYLVYLSELPEGETPMGIVAYRNANYPESISEICKDKYQHYLNAYRAFVATLNPESPCRDFDKYFPIMGFDDFVSAGLCCEYQSLEDFISFIYAFYDPSGCPDSNPIIEDCKILGEVSQIKDCQRLYSMWRHYVYAYNNSAYAQAHQHHLTFSLNINYFSKFEPYCECASEYFRYLSQYINAPAGSNLPLPVDIWDWEGCRPTEYPCDRYYEDYLAVVIAYNAWNQSTGSLLPQINSTYTQSQFGAQNLCQCFPQWKALILGLMAGVYLTNFDDIEGQLDIANYCNGIPCDPETSLTDVVIPNMELEINPYDCEDAAELNAYWDELDAQSMLLQLQANEFIAQYNAHCLHGLTEYLKMSYPDRQYHYTLYYYDQAGNLVKTVPPAGVELLDFDYNGVQSEDSELYEQIQADRANNTHTVNTSHRMATRYEYNSLNQLVRQYLPDHDPMAYTDYTETFGLPSDMIVKDIQFVNETRGYATGTRTVNGVEFGVVYKTDNTGTSWTRMQNVQGSHIFDMVWMDNNRALACGEAGTIMFTTDAGLTWYTVTPSDDIFNDLTTIVSKSSIEAWALGTDGVACGIHWDLAIPTFSISVTNVPVADFTDLIYTGTTFYATSNQSDPGTSKMWTSTNGSTWNPIYARPTDVKSSRASIAPGADLSVIVGNDGQMFLNTGTSNAYFESGITGIKNDILDAYFHNSSVGVAIIANPGATHGNLMHTSNGGVSWSNVTGQTGNYTRLYPYNNGANGVHCKLMASTTTNKIHRVTYTTSLNWSSVPLNGDQNNPSFVWAHRTALPADKTPTLAFYGGNVLFLDEAESTNPDWIPVTLPAGSGNFTQAIGYSENAGSSFTVLALRGTDLVKITKGTNDINPVATSFATNIKALAFNPAMGRYYTVSSTGVVSVYQGTALGVLGTATVSISGTISMAVFQNNVLRIMNTNNESFMCSLSIIGVPTGAPTSMRIYPQPLKTLDYFSNSNGNALLAGGLDGDYYKLSSNEMKRLITRTTKSVNDIEIFDLTATEIKTLNATNSGEIQRITLPLNSFNGTSTTISSGTSEDLMAIEVINGHYMVAGNNNAMRYQNNINSNSSPVVISGQPNGPQLKCLTVVPVQPNTSNMLCISAGTNSQFQRIQGTVRTPITEVHAPALNRTHFADANHGTTVGIKGTMRQTHDGGLTWHMMRPNNGIVPQDIHGVITFADGSATSVGAGGKKQQTLANNAYSEVSIVNAAYTLYDFIKLSDGTTLLAAGHNGTDGISVKYSGSWTIYSGNLTGRKIVALTPLNNNLHAMAVAGNKMLYFQNNTWTVPLILTNNPDIRDIDFYDNENGYLVGMDGYIRKVKCDDPNWNGTILDYVGVTWTESAMESLPGQNDPDQELFTLATTGPNTGMVGGNSTTNAALPHYSMLYNDMSGRYSTLFYYDRLGRVVLSQNSKQRSHEEWITNQSTFITESFYSFTTYDDLGQAVYSGQKLENSIEPDIKSIFGMTVGTAFNPLVINENNLQNWLMSPSGTITELTTTYYSTLPSQVSLQLPAYFQDKLLSHQFELLDRISGITYSSLAQFDISDDDLDGITNEINPLKFDGASYFVYDVTGNVKEVLQQDKKRGETLQLLVQNNILLENHEFKSIEYEYDLISGNVNKISYQQGKADQFFHRYSYDADNRIVEVYTSTNEIIWDNDAKFKFYDHGRLSRIEYGDNQVQGLDFAYTLQGRLKTMNSDLMRTSNDMGHDGDHLSMNKFFGRDIIGYSLGYFHSDYTPIGPTASIINASIQGSDIDIMSNDLWNGNIAYSILNIVQPLGYTPSTVDLPGSLGVAYKYDQLNRLKISSAYNNLTFDINDPLDNGAFGTNGQTLYSNEFEFDPNGNITFQKRMDHYGNEIENLNYKYDLLSPENARNNRLYHIEETVPENDFVGDIDDQGDFYTTDEVLQTEINRDNNYVYNQIGEIQQIKSEDVAYIDWRIDGKINYIQRFEGSNLKNLKFDYDCFGFRTAKHIFSSSGQWEKSVYFIRDLAGNEMASYDFTLLSENEINALSFKLKTRNIYGYSLLGNNNETHEFIGDMNPNNYPIQNANRVIGNKHYQISNHTGNVLSVVSDIKVPQDNDSDNIVDTYSSVLISATDYSPFGVKLYGRTWSVSNYKYGFNGVESDNEIFENADAMFTRYRVYDPRLGRWLSPDPLINYLDPQSPYNGMLNSPILNSDPYGDCPQCLAAFIVDAGFEILDQVIEAMSNGQDIMQALGNIDYGDALWEGTKGAGWAALTGGASSIKKIEKLLTDPKIRVLWNTLTDVLKDAYDAWDEKGWDGISNFDWKKSIAANFTANLISEKAKVQSTSPKTPELQKKMKTVENQYPLKKGGVVNPKAHKDPRYVNAKKELDKTQKKLDVKDATINKTINESIKKTTEAGVDMVKETWSEWKDTGKIITLDSGQKRAVYERTSNTGATQTRLVPYAEF